jgi:hypothetical protein
LREMEGTAAACGSARKCRCSTLKFCLILPLTGSGSGNYAVERDQGKVCSGIAFASRSNS